MSEKTVKVKLLVSRSGPAGPQNFGEEIEVDEAEAKRMLEANPPQCTPVRSARKKNEKAVKE